MHRHGAHCASQRSPGGYAPDPIFKNLGLFQKSRKITGPHFQKISIIVPACRVIISPAMLIGVELASLALATMMTSSSQCHYQEYSETCKIRKEFIPL
jgi:hypothetical protein